MINEELINPKSILVVGGSPDVSKPGGKILKNIIDGQYKGQLYVLNPGRSEVQGVLSFALVNELPVVIDLAILAVSANKCAGIAEELGAKGTKAFIVISAGFSEEGSEGLEYEKQLVAVAEKYNATLIGPNCIGVITPFFNGVFTAPVPKLNIRGCDFVSGSGATAVFILESALPKGLTFSSLFSVGNSAQTGIEEILEFWDNSFDVETSSRIKLVYVENIKDPDKILKHASSLIRKGCKIAAIKSGVTEAGKRATSSHTGAMASADSAVEALFRKAGIVRCFGREELTTVASVFMYKELKGQNIAIITQAGGPGVMLTDALSVGGLSIPRIDDHQQKELLEMLNSGSSAGNPIDILATGTEAQLGNVIEYCDTKMDNIHGMIVIFGSTGLTKLFDAYEMIHEKMKSCVKPVLPILPSVNSAQKEVEFFLSKGHVNFPDEVVLGRALTKVYNTPPPADDAIFMEGINIEKARLIIDQCNNGYQEPFVVQKILQAAGIPTVNEGTANSKRELIRLANSIGYPVVMKVVGHVHKSDVGGVTLNIKSEAHLIAEFSRMKRIKGVQSVLVQKMGQGMELFIGAKYEPRFGHIILCGLGGVFVEALGDVAFGLAPLSLNEAHSMIRSLKAYSVISGSRGREGVDEDKFAEIIVRLSSLLRFATEIKEIDLNPLLGSRETITAVDARILIEK